MIFYGFQSVAVNSMYKLSFFNIYDNSDDEDDDDDVYGEDEEAEIKETPTWSSMGKSDVPVFDHWGGRETIVHHSV